MRLPLIRVGFVLPTEDTANGFRTLVERADRIFTLAQFDDAVKAYDAAWTTRNHAQSKIWFRGHADSSWFLAPPALRESFERDIQQVTHTFVEFKRRASGLVDRPPRTDWGWLYLAQHHGLPTRLLDWSEGSHVALFFALNQRAHDEEPTDGCVWLLSPGHFNQLCRGFSHVVTVDSPEAANTLLLPYLHRKPAEDRPGEIAQPLALIPEHVSPRLRAQRGAFVAFADDESALVRKILEDSAKNPEAPLARPLIVDGASKESLEHQLNLAGVAESTLFPDLDGLCKELTLRHVRGRV